MRPASHDRAAEVAVTSAAVLHHGDVSSLDQRALDWVVLTDPSAASADADGRPIRTRRIVLQVTAAAFVVVALVAVAGILISRRIAERQAVHDVAQITDVLAQGVFQPNLTDAMLTNPQQARATFDPIAKAQAQNSSLVRVKIWTPDGRVLYSDEPRLIGLQFRLDDEAQSALSTPRTSAGVSDLQRPENQYERSQGKLLEVYRPIWTPSGEPLLLEVYFKYDTVRQRSSDLWRGFSGIMLSSLAVIVILLAPLVWALLARTRRARAQQEILSRRALDASQEERRQIAASLHDGVVQQLAAASFAVAGQAERANADHDPALAADLRQSADTIRGGMAGLRSLLVDIYPPNLSSSGLAAALRDAVSTIASRGPGVELAIDDIVADSLPIETQQAVYRVAQEGLRNALRHSGGSHVSLRFIAVDDATAALEITDDGTGFDARTALAKGPQGHFGLRLMRDVAEQCSGWLAVASAPGQGTRVRMEVTRG